jgi:hypothetical protein
MLKINSEQPIDKVVKDIVIALEDRWLQLKVSANLT